ncbi:MAG: hypothetical protein M3T56_17405 [Chloroflexota bacterium]|nr:hypothetical protein [Chloroflexota bacterium]
MKREQLEHVLRAASQIVESADLLVIGSQSVLGRWNERRLPAAAIRSMEADVATLDGDEDKSDLIDGSLGEGSQFHETYGFYAQGVTLKTAVLPAGWRERLVVLQSERTLPGRGLCLEPHDCVASKLVAGRAKDYEFSAALVKAGLIKLDILTERVGGLDIDEAGRERIVRWLEGQRHLRRTSGARDVRGSARPTRRS